MQAELRDKKGIIIPDDFVLVTSGEHLLPLILYSRTDCDPLCTDETDPKFWEQVAELGWTYFDHKALNTLKNHGEWYLTLIDVVSASLSIGFVGTERSTVSTINTKRVQEWNGGVTRMVHWSRR